MSAASQIKEDKIEQMGLEELLKLTKMLQNDLQVFLNSYNGLRSLEQKFSYSKVLVDQIGKKAEVGQELMIPLTESLYVPGKFKYTDKFLVELGTGYFTEFNGEQAQAYCQRKCDFTKKTSDAVQKQLDAKRNFIEKVNVKI